MKVTKHNKLVRDLIPKIISQDGKQAVYTIVTDRFAKLDLLNDKLLEEVNEYVESSDIRELADVLEVIIAIAKTKGHTADYVNSLREDKLESNGGFKEGIVLYEVREDKE